MLANCGLLVLLAASVPVHAATVTIQPSSQDTFIEQDSPFQVFGGSPTTTRIRVQSSPVVRGAWRGLIEFDLSEIPQSSAIRAATLGLYESVDVVPPRTHALHVVTAPWIESTASWNTQPPFAASPSVTFPTGTLGFKLIDVTRDVQAWVDAPETNHGWLIKDADEAEGTAKVLVPYHSRRESDPAEIQFRPKLVVDFGPRECARDQDCLDTNGCTTNERCRNFTCLVDAVGCDDGNPCTGDLCDPNRGCLHSPLCIDGFSCTVDACDPSSGACSNTPMDALCAAGPCVTSVCVGRADPAVDPATGCVTAALADGTPCGPRDFCSGDRSCQSAVCAVPPSDCVDGHVVAFVSNFNAATVSLLATATNTVVGTVPVAAGPWAVAVHPLGREVYVTDREGSGISIIDLASDVVTATIPTGAVPLGVVIDPSGARAYVASYGDDRIEVIDTATRSVAAHIPVRGPAGLAFNPAGTRLYVSSYADRGVVMIDTATNAVLARIPTGRRPLQMALDAVHGRLYVTNFASASVTIIGTFSNTVLATVPVGQKPFAVAVDAERSRVYVTNAASDTVSILDDAAVVVATVPVPRGPLGAGLDRGGTRLYVANGSEDSVSVLDAATGAVSATVTVGALPVAFGAFIGVVANDCPREGLVCDDADPSTTDTCADPSGCAHLPLAGVAAVRAGVDALTAAVTAASVEALGGARTAGVLRAALGSASSALTTEVTSPRALRKQLARAGRLLDRVEHTVAHGLRRRSVRTGLGLELLDLSRGTSKLAQHPRGGQVAAVQPVVAVSTAADVTEAKPPPPFPVGEQ